MIIDRARFNIYLLSAAVLVCMCGCQTAGHNKNKDVATLRVHIEVVPEAMDFSTTVFIYRKNPVPVTVDKSPCLTEADVTSASVVDVEGGYDLRIQFDRRGSWLLENYTTTNPGKHLAIFSSFKDKEKKEARWLAAPIIRGRISNGILMFTPDATHEEAEEIARGLNNVAKQNEEETKW